MIFITGPHGVGKTHTCRLLTRHGYYCVDLGPIIRKLHTESAPKLTLSEWIRRGEHAHGRHFTNNLLAQHLIERLTRRAVKTNYCDIILSGSRSVSGINYIARRLRAFTVYPAKIIYITAPLSRLRFRYCRREGIHISMSKFKKLLAVDRAMGIEEIRKRRDSTIKNDQGSAQLLRQLRRAIKKLYGYSF